MQLSRIREMSKYGKTPSNRLPGRCRPLLLSGSTSRHGRSVRLAPRLPTLAVLVVHGRQSDLVCCEAARISSRAKSSSASAPTRTDDPAGSLSLREVRRAAPGLLGLRCRYRGRWRRPCRRAGHDVRGRQAAAFRSGAGGLLEILHFVGPLQIGCDEQGGQ